MHRTREALIRSRDGMTRFSYAWGPLCRWPGASVEDVRERVITEIGVLREVLPQAHSTYEKPSPERRALRCIGSTDFRKFA